MATYNNRERLLAPSAHMLDAQQSIVKEQRAFGEIMGAGRRIGCTGTRT